jgi:hypothetical protein
MHVGLGPGLLELFMRLFWRSCSPNGIFLLNGKNPFRLFSEDCDLMKASGLICLWKKEAVSRAQIR